MVQCTIFKVLVLMDKRKPGNFGTCPCPRSSSPWLQHCCRMLLHDTMLNDDTFRTGVEVTPLCSCNVEKETVTVMHFLFHCTNYSEARSQLFDSVNDIWMSVSSRVFVQSKEHLILAPQCKDIVTKWQNKILKEVLFAFLATIDKKIYEVPSACYTNSIKFKQKIISIFMFTVSPQVINTLGFVHMHCIQHG